MISPVVKWDHSENYFVIKYDETAAFQCERVFTINISDSDHEYVTGHLIDGNMTVMISTTMLLTAELFQVVFSFPPLVISISCGRLMLK
jgi:hypothetical protein